ncbi:hypothetical protein ACFLQU_05745 [Verrucomicrobiota bacterium]
MTNNPNRDEGRKAKRMKKTMTNRREDNCAQHNRRGGGKETKMQTNASRVSDVSDHPFRGTVINEFGRPLTKACISLIGATVAPVRTERIRKPSPDRV